MFSGCDNIANLDFSSFDTKNVKNMFCMFYRCSNLANQNIVIINKEIKNEICITLKIEKDDVDKEIYFLDNTDGTYNINDKEVNSVHDNLKELNELNTELYIDSIKNKYKKYFIPTEEGNVLIRLKFNNNIQDCSFMFYDCSKITKID